jgi:osmotically-inducible protein OsmY
VKIIAQNGTVTLKGPVRSDEEKQAIEAKATEIAGAGKVNSEIQVAPSK